MVSSVMPINEGDAWVLYLYNPSSADQRITIQFDPSIRVTVRKSDAFGRANDSSPGPITIAANGSLYLRVDRVK
jgi:hypothetical protein